MEEMNLIKQPANKLLDDFGKGSHVPGSGSATAFFGLLSAQLVKTVISLTVKKEGIKRYEKYIPGLKVLYLEIQERIYPNLERLFHLDSEEFNKAIVARAIRNDEIDLVKRIGLSTLAVEELKKPTELLIEIGKLLVEIGDAAHEVFNHGYRAVRGESIAALAGTLAGVDSCIAITNLNLCSFGCDIWVEKIKIEVEMLKNEHRRLSTILAQEQQSLQNEASLIYDYHKEIEELTKYVESQKKYTKVIIKNIASQLQNILWKYRTVIWKTEIPSIPIDTLRPEKALKTLGFEAIKKDNLGNIVTEQGVFDVAGQIDIERKIVHLSDQFDSSTVNFTCAHELGHALLHKSIAKVIHRDRQINGMVERRDPIELEADLFAVNFLMPEKQVRNNFFKLFQDDELKINADLVFNFTGRTDVSGFINSFKNSLELAKWVGSIRKFDGEKNQSLNEIFFVSQEAMGRRLIELGIVGDLK